MIVLEDRLFNCVLCITSCVHECLSYRWNRTDLVAVSETVVSEYSKPLKFSWRWACGWRRYEIDVLKQVAWHVQVTFYSLIFHIIMWSTHADCSALVWSVTQQCVPFRALKRFLSNIIHAFPCELKCKLLSDEFLVEQDIQLYFRRKVLPANTAITATRLAPPSSHSGRPATLVQYLVADFLATC